MKIRARAERAVRRATNVLQIPWKFDWSAGDRALGTFLTDPQSAYGRATFGFFFNLGSSAVIGPWKVEVLVGTQVAVTCPQSLYQGLC